MHGGATLDARDSVRKWGAFCGHAFLRILVDVE